MFTLHGPSPFCSELFLARIALSRRRPAVVYTHHFQVMVEAAGRGRAVLGQAQVAVNTAQESLARVADAVVVTSPTYADIMAHAGVPGAHVIPWGVDAVDPIDDDAVGDGDDHPDHADVRRSDVGHHRPLRVLFVGQMRSYKGIPVLLDALDGLDGVEATLVGGGLEEATYRDRAARLGLTNAVFTGRVPHDELLAAYRSHDVIVLPSVNELEAFGMVLLEGMSAGLVPVSTDLPGLGDVVGDTGRVVPRRDPVALRAALASLAADPLERRRLSDAARHRVRQPHVVAPPRSPGSARSTATRPFCPTRSVGVASLAVRPAPGRGDAAAGVTRRSAPRSKGPRWTDEHR